MFTPRADVTALMESTPVVLGHFRALADGSAAGTVTIPANTVTGWHLFRLTSRRPHPSIGVNIFVQGGLTPSQPPRPPHHPGNPGHHEGPGHGGHNGPGVATNASLELAAAAEPAHGPQADRSDRNLAATGSDKSLVIGGAATALLVAGGGTMLTVRRRRSS
ncbi:hypothetical protein [Streptomyces humidus]|nr:hypothetical protein [Streptomyces humidus]